MSRGGYRVGAGQKPMPDAQYAEKARARIRNNSSEEDRGWTTPCWIWQRRVQHDGYSQTEFRGKKISAHRLAYQLFTGPVPDGLVVDHLCKVLLCCNPAHLEAISNQENQRRSKSFEVVSHCRRGHELTPANLGHDGGYFCRTCRNAKKRERRAKAKAARIINLNHVEGINS